MCVLHFDCQSLSVSFYSLATVPLVSISILPPNVPFVPSIHVRLLMQSSLLLCLHAPWMKLRLPERVASVVVVVVLSLVVGWLLLVVIAKVVVAAQIC